MSSGLAWSIEPEVGIGRRLLATMWVLRAEPRSSGNAASALMLSHLLALVCMYVCMNVYMYV